MRSDVMKRKQNEPCHDDGAALEHDEELFPARSCNVLKDWKQEYWKQVQVNHELARRLKQLKNRGKDTFTDGPVSAATCDRCVFLEREVQRLLSLLKQNGILIEEKANDMLTRRRNSKPLVRSRKGVIRRSSDHEEEGHMEQSNSSALTLEFDRKHHLSPESSPSDSCPTHRKHKTQIEKPFFCGLPPPALDIPNVLRKDAVEFFEQAVIVATPMAVPVLLTSPVSNRKGKTTLALSENASSERNRLQMQLPLDGLDSYRALSLHQDQAILQSVELRTASAPQLQRMLESENQSEQIKEQDIDPLSPTSLRKCAEMEANPMTMSGFLEGRYNWLGQKQSDRKPELSISIASPTNGSSGKRSWISHLMPHRFRSPTSASGSDKSGAFSPPSSRFKTVTETQLPKIVSIYPRVFGRDCRDIEGLSELCFPLGDLGATENNVPPSTLEFDFAPQIVQRIFKERHQTVRQLDATFVLLLPDAVDPALVTYAICMITPILSEIEEQKILKWESAHPIFDQNMRQPAFPRQCCVCLLSKYPFFGLFFKILYGIAAVWDAKKNQYLEKLASLKSVNEAVADNWLAWADFVELFENTLSHLKATPVPRMGAWCHLNLFQTIGEAPLPPISYHRPHTSDIHEERRAMTIEFTAPTLFTTLPMDQITFLLGCLCCELKVVLVSEHVHLVSACVLALVTLLNPLQWAGPIVAVLPPRVAEDLLDAPVPLIAGRVSKFVSSQLPKNGAAPLSPTISTFRHNPAPSTPELNPSREDPEPTESFSTLTKPMRGVIEMNLDHNTLCMHEDDLLQYHKFKLPGCDALVHQVQSASTRVFGSKSEELPNIAQSEACEEITSKIQQQIEVLCVLAMASSTLSDGDCDNENNDERDVPPLHHLMQRRTSESVIEYVKRFQETQMFSNYKNQRSDQVHREEEALTCG